MIGGREGEHADFPINWDWERMNFTEITEDVAEEGDLFDQPQETEGEAEE